MKKQSFFSELIKGKLIRFCSAIICSIGATALGVFTTYLVKYIVDTVIYSNSREKLVSILLLFIGLRIVSGAVSYYSSYSLGYIGQKIAYDLRRKGFDKILSLDFKYFDAHRTGDIMTRMTSDIDFVQTLFSATLPNVIRQVIMFFGSAGVMLFSGGPLVLILMIFIMPTL
ncbi:MAG: ABC transporter transmembrane domain-containing protein, partial [Monoglobales bacterium]